jgi:hypothetical protein
MQLIVAILFKYNKSLKKKKSNRGRRPRGDVQGPSRNALKTVLQQEQWALRQLQKVSLVAQRIGGSFSSRWLIQYLPGKQGHVSECNIGVALLNMPPNSGTWLGSLWSSLFVFVV